MPATTPAAVDATFVALASVETPLPGAALDALTGYAMRDPGRRIPLRIALLNRPELPADLAATLYAGHGGPGVRAAYLLRPEHDEVALRADLDADPADTLIKQLAESPAASPVLLEVLAERSDVHATCLILRHRNATDTTRVTALRRLDGYANDLVLLYDDHAWYAQLTTAVHKGIRGSVAADAAAHVTNPVLLATVLSAGPLDEKAQRRALDLCLRLPLQGGPLRTDTLPRLVVNALARHGSIGVRQEAARLLAAHGITSLDTVPVREALGLSGPVRRPSPRPTATRRWAEVADQAAGTTAAAAELVEVLTAGLGDDPAAWHTLTALAGSFTGKVSDLITTAAAVAADAPAPATQP